MIQPEAERASVTSSSKLKLMAAFAWALGGCSLLAAACVWTRSSTSLEAVGHVAVDKLGPQGLAPGRDLFDVNLFDEDEVGTPYSVDPEEAKAIKVTCVIDAVQAAAYIGEAVTAIYRAEVCPDDEPLGCTAPVAHAVTSIIWVLAFMTSAASTCADTINMGASCAAAIMRDLATAGSTIYGFDEDCFLTRPLNNLRIFQKPKGWFLEHHRRLLENASAEVPSIALYRNKSAEFQRRLKSMTSKRPDEHHAALPNVLFDAATHGVSRSVLDSTVDKIRAVTRHNNAKTERNFALSNCVFDSMNAVGWLMRALLSINEATRACADPKYCVVDVLYVLGSFAYCAQMLSNCFMDCPQYGKREALCGADVTDVVGSMAIFVASTLQARGMWLAATALIPVSLRSACKPAFPLQLEFLMPACHKGPQ